MAIIGYINNTTGSSVIVGSVTILNGVNTVFYNTDLFTRVNFISIVDLIQSLDFVLVDTNGADITGDNAIDDLNNTINEVIMLPVFVPYAFNASIGRYIIGLINTYLIDNYGTSVEHDLIVGLLISITDGLKVIPIDYLDNLTDPFYSTVFKDKISDLISEGFK